MVTLGTPTQQVDEPKLFIVSDTHWNHTNIIKFCDRPFKTVEEMNEELIKRWNSVVGPQDAVLHLGDVGFNYSSLFDIIPRLNGTSKMLIRGNHDWNQERMNAVGFVTLTSFKDEVYKMPHGDHILICAHRPRDLPTWDVENRNTWGARNIVLCGHEHNNAPVFIKWVRDKGDTARPVMALNMSCEWWDYTPVESTVVIATYQALLAPHIKQTT